MSVGEVFTKAYELWKKDVLWLILAALVVGLIIAVIAGIMFAIVFGIALGGVGIGLSASGDSISGVGAGMIFLAIIGYIIGIFVIMVVAMTFYGGIFEMVIGAAKERRPVRFGDLFSGFKKFGAYALFAAVMAGIVIGLSLLNIIPILGTIVMIAALVWIEVLWLYVLPLIADRGMGFGEAQTRSREMVKSTGWWKTFGTLILLMVAIWVVGLIIMLISAGLSRASESAGSIIGGLLFIVFEVAVGPYAICYIATMYLESEGTQPVMAGAGAVPPPPAAATFAAPPAPPTAPVTPAAPAAGPATPVTPTQATTPAAPLTPPSRRRSRRPRPRRHRRYPPRPRRPRRPSRRPQTRPRRPRPRRRPARRRLRRRSPEARQHHRHAQGPGLHRSPGPLSCRRRPEETDSGTEAGPAARRYLRSGRRSLLRGEQAAEG